MAASLLTAKLGKRSIGAAGYWCAALDPGQGRLYCGSTEATIHVYDPGRPGDPPSASLTGHGSYVTILAAATESDRLISGGYDRKLIGWGLSNRRPVWTSELAAPPKRAAISPDGKLVAVTLDDLRVGLWDTATGKPVRLLEGQHSPFTEIGRPSTVYCVAWSPDGALLATGDRNGEVCLWEVATGKPAGRVDARSLYSQALLRNPMPPSEYEWGGVRSLCFSPDGRVLFAGGMGPADQNSAGLDGLMEIVALDPATRKGITRLPLEKCKGVLAVIVPHPGGKHLVGAGGGGGAGAGGSGTLCTWEFAARDEAGKPVPPGLFPSAMVVRDMAVTPDGRQALLVGMEKSVTAGRVEWWELGTTS